MALEVPSSVHQELNQRSYAGLYVDRCIRWMCATGELSASSWAGGDETVSELVVDSYVGHGMQNDSRVAGDHSMPDND